MLLRVFIRMECALGIRKSRMLVLIYEYWTLIYRFFASVTVKNGGQIPYNLSPRNAVAIHTKARLS